MNDRDMPYFLVFRVKRTFIGGGTVDFACLEYPKNQKKFLLFGLKKIDIGLIVMLMRNNITTSCMKN